MSFTEVVLSCINCKNDFTFTSKEHEFRASKGFPNEPLLCHSCRQVRNTRSTQSGNRAITTHQSDSYFR